MCKVRSFTHLILYIVANAKYVFFYISWVFFKLLTVVKQFCYLLFLVTLTFLCVVYVDLSSAYDDTNGLYSPHTVTSLYIYKRAHTQGVFDNMEMCVCTRSYNMSWILPISIQYITCFLVNIISWLLHAELQIEVLWWLSQLVMSLMTRRCNGTCS